LGRSMQYAAAAGGELGLAKWWETLINGVSITLALIGKTKLDGMSDSLHQ